MLVHRPDPVAVGRATGEGEIGVGGEGARHVLGHDLPGQFAGLLALDDKEFGVALGIPVKVEGVVRRIADGKTGREGRSRAWVRRLAPGKEFRVDAGVRTARVLLVDGDGEDVSGGLQIQILAGDGNRLPVALGRVIDRGKSRVGDRRGAQHIGAGHFHAVDVDNGPVVPLQVEIEEDGGGRIGHVESGAVVGGRRTGRGSAGSGDVRLRFEIVAVAEHGRTTAPAAVAESDIFPGGSRIGSGRVIFPSVAMFDERSADEVALAVAQVKEEQLPALDQLGAVARRNMAVGVDLHTRGIPTGPEDGSERDDARGFLVDREEVRPARVEEVAAVLGDFLHFTRREVVFPDLAEALVVTEVFLDEQLPVVIGHVVATAEAEVRTVEEECQGASVLGVRDVGELHFPEPCWSVDAV